MWKSCKIKEKHKSLRDFSDAVTLLDVCPSIKEYFDEKKLKEIASDSIEVRKRKLFEFYKFVLKNLESYSSITNSTSYRSYELVQTPAQSMFTGYDFVEKKIMGLHIDVHESLPMKDVKNAFNLLSINLGDNERYFYFVDLSVPKIIKMLQDTQSDSFMTKSASEYKLKDHFFKKFPNYPVHRLKIMPGQAYIATTQAIIHDGGTNNKGVDDFTFFIPGKFKCMKK